MKKLLTIILVLCTLTSFAQTSGNSPYDPGAARKNLSNVDALQLKLGAGTAAAPAYSFSSDPDTGIYSAGANVLGFGVGGAENARITSGGNVLIATSTDDGANKLQVNGFTKLGEAATGIKMKVLTGTTAETEGNIATINHGLTGDKIVSFTLIVRYEDNKGVEAEYSAHSGYKFHVLCTDYQFLIINDGTESESILSRPIVITVWYTE